MNMKRFGEWMLVCAALLLLFFLSLGILFTAHNASATDVIIYDWEEADLSRPQKCRQIGRAHV